MTIKELRTITGLSQSQFAKKFHIPVSSVQNWEINRRQPPDYVIWLIQRILELENQQ